MLPTIPPEFPWHVLRDPSVKKIFHNALNFDLPAMYRVGYNIDETNIADTLIIAYLLNQPPRLVNLATTIGLEIMDITDLLVDKNMTMLDAEETDVAKKCCLDAQATLAIYNHYISIVDRDYYNVEIALIPMLLEMSRKGLQIDNVVREELDIELSKSVEPVYCSIFVYNPVFC